MTKVADWLVQDKEEHDDCLHRELFPVNIRLLNSDDNNAQYRFFIQHAITYMHMAMEESFSDYNELQGISGANVGIPYNIVIVPDGKRDNGDRKWLVLLNPTILRRSKKTKRAKTNCGSLNLKDSVEVLRHEWIDVEYYEFQATHMKASKKRRRFKTATMQHEIDHNNGILITSEDRCTQYYLDMVKEAKKGKQT